MNNTNELLSDPFYLRLNVRCKKGETLLSGDGHFLVIVKTYHHTWWRKILSKFGLKLKPLHTYKVKMK